MWTLGDTVAAIIDPAVCIGTFAITSLLMYFADQWPWYNKLRRAPWEPPGWVFGVAWAINYMLLAAGGILVRYYYDASAANHNIPVFITGQVAYYMQFALHILWVVVFSWMRSTSGGFMVILFTLMTSIVMAVLFYIIHWVPGLLVTFYVLWIALATSLSAYVYAYNRAPSGLHMLHNTRNQEEGISEDMASAPRQPQQQQQRRPPLTKHVAGR
jgi:tryptophan-rich sensory protein